MIKMNPDGTYQFVYEKPIDLLGQAQAKIAELQKQINQLNEDNADVAFIAHMQGVEAERSRWLAKLEEYVSSDTALLISKNIGG